MTADNNSSLNLASRLSYTHKIMSLNLFIKRVHKLLIKQKFHNGDKKTYKNNAANNTLRQKRCNNTCIH